MIHMAGSSQCRRFGWLVERNQASARPLTPALKKSIALLVMARLAGYALG
jgi:hypothetical protein